jgi:recombination protein RecT
MNDTVNPPSLIAIGKSKERFESITLAANTRMTYESESMFAMQAIQKSDYIYSIANKAPDSVRNAVINVASIGLSLNPATAYAYLVPRDGRICLDISYQGLIKIATDTGSIRWAKAELVYSNDNFLYKGVAVLPVHEFNPFGDRGDFAGVYCVAKTSDGDYLVETMTADQITEIRNKSEAYKAFAAGKARQCPWVDFFGEMTKKTCIKRASKTWPKSQRGDRLQTAISILNENGEGIDFNAVDSVVEHKSKEQVEKEQYDALCEMYIDTLTVVRESLANDDYSTAKEAWAELGEEAQTALWKAPSKGGWFTTKERAQMKDDNWAAA